MTSEVSRIYGPHREVTWQRYKEACTKDSVREALNNGEHGGDKELVWITSTKESYQGKTKKLDDVHNNQSRDATNFMLGFDKPNYLTTNQDYKQHPGVKTINYQQTDHTTHIADFSPKYSDKHSSLDPSEYQLSFQAYAIEQRPVPKSLKERRKHTNDLRETHFMLGDSSCPKTSETKHSFGEITSAVPVVEIQKSNALETYVSKVFRSGDWNHTDRSLVKAGVTHQDFHPHHLHGQKETSPNTLNHRGTHFNLGSGSDKNNSVYQKDFTLSTERKTTKPSFEGTPPPAKLLASDYSTAFVTTQQDFYRDRQLDALELRKQRQLALEKVRQRHQQKAVPLSPQHGGSLVSTSEKPISMTTSDFPKHLVQLDDSKMPVISVYNHLSSNNENKTKISEAKACFTPHKNVSTALRDECQTRRRDNKSTHFLFGTDSIHENQSEQCSQYRVPLPVDPTLQAAGKGLPQGKIYSHVYPCLQALEVENRRKGYASKLESESMRCEKLPSSVMKQDFKELQLHTPKLTNEHVSTPLVNSHYFHMDHQFSGTQMSTTQLDFKAPDIPFDYLSDQNTLHL